MVKIKDINTALQVFEENAFLQTEATKEGDYKTGNKCYDRAVKAYEFLKKENAVDSLFGLLSSPEIGPRLWAASYLLPLHEKEAVEVLEEISKLGGILSGVAKDILKGWEKGTLKF